MATTTSSDPKPAPLETPLLSDVHLSLGEASLSQPPAKSIEVYEPSIAAASGYTNHGLEGELSKKVHFVSLVVNILLFGSKLWVYVQSQSMVVLAALIDSTVDLLAQAILLLTNRLATRYDSSPMVPRLCPCRHAIRRRGSLRKGWRGRKGGSS